MKKLIVLFALLLSVSCVKAQNFKEDGSKYVVFCKVICLPPYGSYWDLIINNKKYAIIDKEGEIIKTKEVTEVLNLLAKRGWNLVSSYANDKMFHYIMMKEIVDDKEIEVGLTTK